MNYGEVKQNIIDLGFSDLDELEEFGVLVPNAINRAVTEISLSVAPNVSYIDITHPINGMKEDDWYKSVGNDENGNPLPSYADQLYEYTMPDDFLKFTEVPVKRQLGEGIYQRFNDFEIESGNTLIMSGQYIGTYRVFYIADHEPFTLKTSNGEDIPLPLKAHYLVPLLASYYVWLDDDPQKAQEYYQRYQQGVQTMTSESQKPRARIRNDWGGLSCL